MFFAQVLHLPAANRDSALLGDLESLPLRATLTGLSYRQLEFACSICQRMRCGLPFLVVPLLVHRRSVLSTARGAVRSAGAAQSQIPTAPFNRGVLTPPRVASREWAWGENWTPVETIGHAPKCFNSPQMT